MQLFPVASDKFFFLWYTYIYI